MTQPVASFWRRFGVLFGIGAIGVLALLPVAVPAVRRQLEANPEIGIPLEVLVPLSLINPLILLALTVAVGIRLAPKVGLRSHLDDRVTTGAAVLPRLRPELPLALLLGAIGGTALVLLDLAMAPWLGGVLDGLPEAERGVAETVTGLLYGGVTEELMLRWGVMSFLAWAAWKLVWRGEGRPAAGVMWGAIIGAAIAFGVGHLPALAAAGVPLTVPVVVRTIALNALGGIIFGWLFWRRSLEAAMVSHASFHIVFTLFAWLG